MGRKTEQEANGSEPNVTALEARHLPGALALSQEMGWPYRLEDWEFASAMGHGLVLERGAEVIGTAMWWTYGQTHACAGMIIVTAAEQGRGYGALLLDSLLQATEGRDVLLSATEEGLALYERRGFMKVGPIVQHQGLFETAVPSDSSDGIRSAMPADLPLIHTFDRQATGLDRVPLVNALAREGRLTLMERAGRIVGYVITRRFGRGYVVGPVAAECGDDAKRLILSQLSTLHGKFVRIDVHARHGLSDWLESLGLTRVSPVTAMVKGRQPVPEGPASMFALASQSFG
ncbi:N-acetyltransferase [Hwanghaeella grinnelliae]|uniref:N-acetyltransferase n=1 Tax=Hwanghaeella grinnelliae TaxID=2500179 RepID=A0A3S2Z7R2_9PROT|nr:GNAT family N-acetyltransferase [Hwanghaeella grinnelliae]RVU35232.1 N-acetyltransferase [Hwanghaeella grinnelliae]